MHARLLARRGCSSAAAQLQPCQLQLCSSMSSSSSSIRPPPPLLLACAQPRRRCLVAAASGTSTSSSAGGSAKQGGVSGRGKPAASSAGASASGISSLAASATTAAAVAATAEHAARPAALGGVGAPAGFVANNIVPAGPLGQLAPPPPPGIDATTIDSSDEELDAGEAAAAGDEGARLALGTGRGAPWRCLVLDSRYLPVNVISWHRAVVMDYNQKADVLEWHPGGFAYSAYKAHPLPAVLRVRTFVDVHEFAGKLSLTRKNIMLRDQHRCQYCGGSKDLTLDHVLPVSRGGANSWVNLVTACMACNQRKGDKSLAQLGWRLPRAPREPTPQEVGIIAGISKGDLEQPPLTWAPYLATFKAVLEKAQRRAARESASGSSSSSSSYSLSGSCSSSSSSSSKGGFSSQAAAQQLELLGLPSAGGGSSSGAKGAAAAGGPGGGGGVRAAAVGAASGDSKQQRKARGASSNAKRMRH